MNSLFPFIDPNTSCVFESAEVWKDKNKDSEESTCKEEKFHNSPFIPSYLCTDNGEETAAVTPSPKRKLSNKRVLFDEKVEFISDDDTVKISNKKSKKYSQESPSHDTVCSAIDRAWSYDNDDLLYCSNSWSEVR